nr:hypothetical protein CFP56_46824 [Quercus suber]
MDMLPAPLHEHRLREEKIKADRAQRMAAAASAKAAEPKKPQNPTQAFLQRPPLLRPNSTGFFGNLHQGFLRAATSSPTPSQQFPKSAPVSGSSTPSNATTPNKEVNHAKLTAQMEKYIAEQKRDADMLQRRRTAAFGCGFDRKELLRNGGSDRSNGTAGTSSSLALSAGASVAFTYTCWGTLLLTAVYQWIIMAVPFLLVLLFVLLVPLLHEQQCAGLGSRVARPARGVMSLLSSPTQSSSPATLIIDHRTFVDNTLCTTRAGYLHVRITLFAPSLEKYLETHSSSEST